MLKLALIFGFIFGVVPSVYAACTNPVADAASIFYNTTVNTVQFCDGTDWVNTALKNPTASGTSCTNPTGPEASMYYNTSQNTVQFCDGDNWVNMGTMKFPSATGTACTNPTGPEASMFFNTSVNRLQFCNGDDWVNATYFSVASLAIQGVQTHKIVSTDLGADDQFGYAVAVDGNTAIVSALLEDSNGPNSGSAYIFDITTGSQLHKLSPVDAASEDTFGDSVAISGNYAIVGARYEDTGGLQAGAAYIFDVTTGNQLHKLMAADAQAGDFFGHSVAISGNIAIVGAVYEDTAASDSGAVYVFDVTSGNQLRKLTASDAQADDLFGISVALDGDMAIIGSYLDDTNGSNSGGAYIFDVSTGNQLHKLLASDGQASDQLGRSVSISGNIAIAGSHTQDSAGSNAGAAYVFNVTTGAQLYKLTASDAQADDYFGHFVSISGENIVIGAYGEDSGGTDSGAIYAFDASTGNELHKLMMSDSQAGDGFGFSGSIDGVSIISGARLKGSNAGAAYIFK
jgi:hypothetical protein